MSAVSSPTSPTTNTGSSSSSNSSSSTGVDDTMIASNFTTFLQLLTTQLKNQDPLSPMDTNQFTQQLVEFAQVEQQMKSNDQLGSLVSMEQSAQQTTALAYVGSTVVVDGSTAALNSSGATWAFNVTRPATATVTIRDSTGQTAYTGSFAVNPGDQKFTWDGKGNDGTTWPAGSYTMSVTAVDANKNTVAISTEVEGVVDSVDLTQTPPVLSVNGGNYTMDKIKRIVVPSYAAPPTDGSGSGSDSGSGSGSGSDSGSGSGSGSSS
jgi:flagellar basal-body rod modification protein FlgD